MRLIACLLLCCSLTAHAMVVGYEFDFATSEMVIDGTVASMASFTNGEVQLDVYKIHVEAIPFHASADNPDNLFRPTTGSDIQFVYARNLIWPHTGYDAMLRDRVALSVGTRYLIPVKFDAVLALYSLSDRYYVVQPEEPKLRAFVAGLPAAGK